MLRVESLIPGFGGFYVDSLDRLVVHMKNASQVTLPSVIDALVTVYSPRPEPRVQEIMSHVGQTQVIDGRYSISELIAIEDRIWSPPVPIPGVVGVGSSMLLNKVKVGFKSAASMQDGLAAIRMIGIPLDALVPEVWEEIHVTANWTSIVRPTRGGPQIQVANQPWAPNYVENASLGYNVRTPDGTEYMLTVAHASNALRTNHTGFIGDTVFQATTGNGAIGTVTVNPAWSTTCQPAPDGTPVNYCPVSDAMLMTYMAGIGHNREIGTSDYEGLNGGVGCCNGHIHGYYPVGSVATPEWMQANGSLGVHKSGFKTGTTTGPIDVASARLIAPYCDGPNPTGICPPNQVRLLAYMASRSVHIGWGVGDSGSPVFGGNGSPYYALGIQTAGEGHMNGSGICDAGMACFVWFTRWSDIVLHLGLQISPTTVQ
jgi:hypothetical protein